MLSIFSMRWNYKFLLLIYRNALNFNYLSVNLVNIPQKTIIVCSHCSASIIFCPFSGQFKLLLGLVIMNVAQKFGIKSRNFLFKAVECSWYCHIKNMRYLQEAKHYQ